MLPYGPPQGSEGRLTLQRTREAFMESQQKGAVIIVREDATKVWFEIQK
jgi:hypothetical protein